MGRSLRRQALTVLKLGSFAWRKNKTFSKTEIDPICIVQYKCILIHKNIVSMFFFLFFWAIHATFIYLFFFFLKINHVTY